MEHTLLKRKILEHLEGLNELDKKTDARTLIQVIAERYNTPEEIVEKTIAETKSGDYKAISLRYLVDHQDSIYTIAQWYYNQWGNQSEHNSFDKILGNINRRLSSNKLPTQIVAIENETLVGTASIKIKEMEIFPERVFWLGDVYVDEVARGKK